MNNNDQNGSQSGYQFTPDFGIYNNRIQKYFSRVVNNSVEQLRSERESGNSRIPESNAQAKKCLIGYIKTKELVDLATYIKRLFDPDIQHIIRDMPSERGQSQPNNGPAQANGQAHTRVPTQSNNGPTQQRVQAPRRGMSRGR
jgi:hypothetical protein